MNASCVFLPIMRSCSDDLFSRVLPRNLFQVQVNSAAGRCILVPRPATLLKKRLRHKCFPVNFTKFVRATFLQDTSERLLQGVKFLEIICKEVNL